MGYYINFEITTKNEKDGELAVIAKRINALDGVDGDAGEGLEYEFESKWHGEESDMIEISREFPHVEFTVHGIGEESGDEWYHHYLDGKIQVRKGKMIFPDYDPNAFK